MTPEERLREIRDRLEETTTLGGSRYERDQMLADVVFLLADCENARREAIEEACAVLRKHYGDLKGENEGLLAEIVSEIRALLLAEEREGS